MEHKTQDDERIYNENTNIPLKPNQEHGDFSTEFSDVNKESVDLDNLQYNILDEPVYKADKKDQMTPNPTIKRKKKRLIESERRGNIKRNEAEIIDSWKPANQHKFNHNKDKFQVEANVMDTVVEDLSYAKEVVSKKLSYFKDSVAAGNQTFKNDAAEFIDKAKEIYAEAKEDLTTVLGEAKEVVTDKVGNLIETVKTDFNIIKEKAAEVLGMNEEPEIKIVDLEKEYAKLDDIKNNEKMDEIEKLEEVLNELEKIPLDPSHVHDDEIHHPDLYRKNENIIKYIPDVLKAEDPDYKRAEAIKNIIIEQGWDIIHHEYLSVQDASRCIDEAIKKLEMIAEDPIINPKVSPRLVTFDETYTDEDKLYDPDYKRAEAIKIFLLERGTEFAKLVYQETDEDANLIKEEETVMENVRDKLAHALSAIKDNASKLWNKAVDTVVSVENKVEESFANLSHDVNEDLNVNRPRSNDVTDANKINAELVRVDVQNEHIKNMKTENSELKKDDLYDIDLISDKDLDLELTKPLLEDEKREKKIDEEVNLDSTTPVLTDNIVSSESKLKNPLSSNLEVNRRNSGDKQENIILHEKLDEITPKDLKAQVGVPDFSQTHKYGHEVQQEKVINDTIPKNGGLLVNTDTKMVNYLHGLKDPHREELKQIDE